MIKFLDFYNLRLKIAQLSDNISDNDIIKIIQDEQFDQYNYDYDILYIIDILYGQNVLDINKPLEDIELWVETFISRLKQLSKHFYSDDEIIIFKKLLFYKIIKRNNNIIINGITEEQLNDILNTLFINIEENSSAWLAKEKLRLILLDLYLTNNNLFQNNINTITEQLQIAQLNETKRIELNTILLHIMSKAD